LILAELASVSAESRAERLHLRTHPSGRHMRTWRFIFCVTSLLIVQVTVVHRFSYGPWRPNLLYLCAAFVALDAPFSGAIWSAFVIGALADLSTCGRMGAGAFILVLACSAMLFLRHRLLRGNLLTDIALVFAFVFFAGAFHAVALALFTRGGAFATLLRAAAGEAAFTALLALLFFPFFHKLGIVADGDSGGAK